uniref:Uncharacterized protein n=1 Tax=Cacopsylla melanoneura TaxID=428564 RepID=A0A8D8T546_9HEMI
MFMTLEAHIRIGRIIRTYNKFINEITTFGHRFRSVLVIDGALVTVEQVMCMNRASGLKFSPLKRINHVMFGKGAIDIAEKFHNFMENIVNVSNCCYGVIPYQHGFLTQFHVHSCFQTYFRPFGQFVEYSN